MYYVCYGFDFLVNEPTQVCELTTSWLDHVYAHSINNVNIIFRADVLHITNHCMIN